MNHTLFQPHGACFLWEPWILYPYLVGNLMIGLAYFAIPVVMLRLFPIHVRALNKDFIVLTFFYCLFILFCGLGHFVKIFTVFHPAYYLESWIDVFTGIISVISLWVLVTTVRRLEWTPKQ